MSLVLQMYVNFSTVCTVIEKVYCSWWWHGEDLYEASPPSGMFMTSCTGLHWLSLKSSIPIGLLNTGGIIICITAPTQNIFANGRIRKVSTQWKPAQWI